MFMKPFEILERTDLIQFTKSYNNMDPLSKANSIRPMETGGKLEISIKEEANNVCEIKMNKIINEVKSSAVFENKCHMWKYVANVMNRLFFYLSIIWALGIYIGFTAESVATLNKAYHVSVTEDHLL